MTPRTIRSFLLLAISSALLCPSAFAAPLGSDDVVIADAAGRVLRVDRDTGERALLSARHLGDGPTLGLPAGLAVGTHGVVYSSTAATASASIFAIDPMTGDRAILFDEALSVPDGFALTLSTPAFVATAPSGEPWLANSSGYVLAIDPDTGDVSIVTSSESCPW